jgi:hypothetical protein
MKTLNIFILTCSILIAGCKPSKPADTMKTIPESTIQELVNELGKNLNPDDKSRLERGIQQVAKFWTDKDGTTEEFVAFCKDNHVPTKAALIDLVPALERNHEILMGYFNTMNVLLKEPLHLDGLPLTKVDLLFGGYEPGSHVAEDFFRNKIAFFTMLNFPYYNLDEKLELGKNWTREDWVIARMGDMFTSRVPGELNQQYGKIVTDADTYISEYNIVMGDLVTSEGKKLFPDDLKLISHWGLRDEIKSNYGQPGGLEKQQLIYEVMKRVITQEIPGEIINQPGYQWNPYNNELMREGSSVTFTAEPATRYQHLLNNFKALVAMDEFNPHYPTYIQRAFDEGLEIPMIEVEELFVNLVSSSQAKETAQLISERLGRPLEPFDLWYDGFKARSSISPEELDHAVNQKYPSKDAFEKDIPNILVKLGFAPTKAQEIASRIRVDASRGAGHAWGAATRSDKARLRTKVGANGMDYKGYNIAMHELGHCVEQTITLHDMDYYTLNGIPNTAFTEALAFIFQKRDLDVLGIKDKNPLKPHLEALDIFWGNFEIMGVSLVDMKVWQWLYANPGASAKDLKDAVNRIAVEVWNQYYADIFGVRDQPILAIYSHMISYPLYLSAYPLGHLIEFQIEKQIQGKPIADEVLRMFTQGKLTPRAWMNQAVGGNLSNDPLLEAVSVALEKVK